MNAKTPRQGHHDDSELTLWDIMNLLLRKAWLLLFSGLLAGVIVYLAVSLLITPTYRSHVSFYVFNNTGSSQSGTINNGDLQAAESLATTYSKILASNSILDAVLEDLGPEANLTRKELSGMTEISVVSGTQLLEVVVTSTDPRFACEIADSFARTAPTEIVRITKAGGVEVVDRPEVATEKSAPRTVFDSVIGFLVGVLVAAAVVVARSLSDSTIYLPEDITAAADVTVLGQIPTIEPAGTMTGWKLAEGGSVQNETNENNVLDGK